MPLHHKLQTSSKAQFLTQYKNYLGVLGEAELEWEKYTKRKSNDYPKIVKVGTIKSEIKRHFNELQLSKRWRMTLSREREKKNVYKINSLPETTKFFTSISSLSFHQPLPPSLPPSNPPISAPVHLFLPFGRERKKKNPTKRLRESFFFRVDLLSLRV